MNYYQHPYCSNSQLTALKLELSAPDEIRIFKEAFRLGTLFDAMITEPKRIDYIRRRIDDYEYSEQEIQNNRSMRQSLFADPFAIQLINICEGQKEFFVKDVPFQRKWIDNPRSNNTDDSFNVDFCEMDWTMNCRCKYDGYSNQLGWGYELKSTAATSQAQFELSIDKFDYDRAAYFYMKVSNSNQLVIIGVSKKFPHNVFKKFVRTGDELWKRGEAKCNELAFKWWMLKDTLRPGLITTLK